MRWMDWGCRSNTVNFVFSVLQPDILAGAGRVLGEDFKARRRKEAKLAKQLQHREEKKKKIDFSLFKSDEVPLETFLSPEDLIPPSAQSDDHHDETAF